MAQFLPSSTKVRQISVITAQVVWSPKLLRHLFFTDGEKEEVWCHLDMIGQACTNQRKTAWPTTQSRGTGTHHPIGILLTLPPFPGQLVRGCAWEICFSVMASVDWRGPTLTKPSLWSPPNHYLHACKNMSTRYLARFPTATTKTA